MTNLTAFVTTQNAARSGVAANLLYTDDTGSVPATSATNIALGWQAGTVSLPTVEAGTGGRALYNALVLDGSHGMAGYQFNVDATGALSITDESTGGSMSVSGLTYVLFNDGAANSAGYLSSDIGHADGGKVRFVFKYRPVLPCLI